MDRVVVAATAKTVSLLSISKANQSALPVSVATVGLGARAEAAGPEEPPVRAAKVGLRAEPEMVAMAVPVGVRVTAAPV